MSTFLSSNKKAIRRLSKLSASVDLQQLMQAYGSPPQTLSALPTPPPIRPTSRSPSRSSSARTPLTRHCSRTIDDTLQLLQHNKPTIPESVRSSSTTIAHVSPVAAMSALMAKMNNRTKVMILPATRQTDTVGRHRTRSVHSIGFQPPIAVGSTLNSLASGNAIGLPALSARAHTKSQSATGSLRAFRLQASAIAEDMNRRSDVPRA